MVSGPPVSQRFEKRKEKFVLGSSEIRKVPVLLVLCTRMSRPCGVIGHQQGKGLTAPAVPACKAAAASRSSPEGKIFLVGFNVLEFILYSVFILKTRKLN